MSEQTHAPTEKTLAEASANETTVSIVEDTIDSQKILFAKQLKGNALYKMPLMGWDLKQLHKALDNYLKTI